MKYKLKIKIDKDSVYMWVTDPSVGIVSFYESNAYHCTEAELGTFYESFDNKLFKILVEEVEKDDK